MPPFLYFKTLLKFHCARDTSNTLPRETGSDGEMVHVAPVYTAYKDLLLYFISSLMASVARLYVKEWGTQLCEQISLIHI